MARILCLECSCAARNKNEGPQRLSPGHYAFPKAKTGHCNICNANTPGLEHCLACAITYGLCQGCDQKLRSRCSEALLAAVDALRQTFEAARQLTYALFEETIAPFKDAAQLYEARLRASEEQLNAEWRTDQRAAHTSYCQRNDEIVREFAEYADYSKACRIRDGAVRRTIALFAAGVERAYAIAQAEEIYNRAVDSQDRLDAIFAS